MPSSERDCSSDRDTFIRGYSNMHESTRSMSIPMWDSSDPDRAPPPLPLNPGVSSSPTKPNTSAGIAAAAKAIVEKARESAPISSYTSNAPLSQSPERQLIKGAHHRRFQSLQPGSVKDLRSYLDGSRSPDKSPERPASRGALSPLHSLSNQASRDDIFAPIDRTSTPTPSMRDTSDDTPSAVPAFRARHHSFMGESTPPSATMRALQTMQVPDTPTNDIPIRPNTPSGTPTRTNNTYDFSSQLLNLTAIATNLQKEMASLSRRSKDNATDLISLKEATSQRDEDIRKSLKDLASQVQTSTQSFLGPSTTSRSIGSAFTTSFLDAKPFSTPPSATRTFDVPRASSVHSFLDDTRITSPSPYSVEGAASVAMLEKVIREMVTKEGQERLLDTLSDLLEKTREENVEASKKVEELAEYIKTKPESQALVPINIASGSANAHHGNSPEHSSDLDEELIKLLTRIKDSVAHAGGTSSEVKGIVRDLRGEVLGMGRELGRKLEQLNDTQLNNALDKSIENNDAGFHSRDVQRIVEESMADLKGHIATLLTDHLGQQDTTKQLSTITTPTDRDQMFAVVKHALVEHSHDNWMRREQSDVDSGISVDRDGVIDAVREGLKDFEPNIELQQFGLERDEILAVLREGLEDHQRGRSEVASYGIDKGEVYEAMQEALKDFRAPIAADVLDRLREDIISDVREALQHNELSATRAITDDEQMKATVETAVRDGLATYGPTGPRELEISREDLFDAVKASLDGTTVPFGSFGEQVIHQMHELIDGMRSEFKQYSSASGRDTEQVLDAVKDGLEALRGEIENYVDRAQDVTGKDEIVDTVRGGLEQLRTDVQGYCSEGSTKGRAELLDYIKSEFEHLHNTLNGDERQRSLDTPRHDHTAEIIMAVKEGMENLKTHVDSRSRDLDDDDSHEDMVDAMRMEFDQLKAALLNAHAADKGELVETIQDSMGALHSRLGGSELSQATSGANSDIIHEMQCEFATLKESIHEIVINAERENIISGVRQTMEDMRTHLSADQNDASAEALGALKEELEAFRDSLATSLVPGGHGDKEMLDAIHDHVKDLTANQAKDSGDSVPVELLEAMRGEFEQLRTMIMNSGATSGRNEEVSDALRLGLDDLRSHLDTKLERNQQPSSNSDEVLDAINDGLESLKAEVIKTLDKPLDMTVNYEILDLLKEGLTALRSDVDSLKSGTKGKKAAKSSPSGEIVLADGNRAIISQDSSEHDEEDASVSSEGELHEDIEALGVLIHQLQIKVEAMDATVHDSSASQDKSNGPSSELRDQLMAVEVMIREVQGGLNILTEQGSKAAPEGAARKEDTDALETLLRNTKAQIEEIQISMPPAEMTVTKEHLDSLEAVTHLVQESVNSLAERVEQSTAAKGDVAVVEVLAQDIKAVLDEMKETLLPENKSELVTKADLDVLGIICTDIKLQVESLASRDEDATPAKADLERLHDVIKDFRESHEKLRDSYETDIAVTAKAFDDRKIEFEETVSHIHVVKDALVDAKEEIMVKLMDNDSGVNTLGETLKELELKLVENQPLVETMKQEFERAHLSLEGLKAIQQESSDAAAEHKFTIIGDLKDKLESLFDGLMCKYDDAQTAALEKAQVMEDKATQQQDLLESTKTMAEELRLSIDTLGTALTTFTSDGPAQMERMLEDHKVVFNKVEDTWNKVDEAQAGLKQEHSSTREEIVKVMDALNAVQQDMMDHNPRFLVTLQEVQALMSQHRETAQKACDAADEHREAVRELSSQLKAGFDETRNRHAEQAEELKTTLPALMAPEPERGFEQYDDSGLHAKLDEIISHNHDNESSTTQLARLDQIHERVMLTAAEVSAFVSTQARQLKQDHEQKEKEAEELALLVERRMVQKDEIESDISALNDEKEALRRAVDGLCAEKEALAAAKSRLNADVSSLETALSIRRDELHEMDIKAETLEHRILEGVMNQSRMLLLSQPSKPAPKKKSAGRDLRTPSMASAKSSQTVTSTVPALRNNHALAMKTRAAVSRNGVASNTAERRIMSLNQINHNVPTGGQAFSTTTPSLLSNGPPSVARSQSVRTFGQSRKTSWAPKRNTSLSLHDKENERLSEEDELDYEHSIVNGEGDDDDFISENGTERRHSYMTDSQSNDTFHGDEDHSVLESAYSGRHSYGTGRLSYESGSYMTSSELDRRSSLASTSNGANDHSRHHEDYDEQDAGHSHDDMQMTVPPLKRTFSPPSDSGLGSELPSATVAGSDLYHGGDK